MFYDRDGIPVSREQWALLLDDAAYRQVQYTNVADAATMELSYNVSTIWLGLDQSYGWGVSLPIIFETMVFGAGEFDRYTERWATLATAEGGHVRVVTMLAATMGDPVVTDVALSDIPGGGR